MSRKNQSTSIKETTKSNVKREKQSVTIKKAINAYLDSGETDKQTIYTEIVSQLKVPRPSVRRVTRDLLKEMEEKIETLKDKDLQRDLHKKITVLRSVNSKKTNSKLKK